MQEKAKLQHIPVKVYRTPDRLMVVAPMPGLIPEDILIEVTADKTLILQGELRGTLKDVKELLVDEWSVGGYYREISLSDAVDGVHANVTYGNGVLVVALPISTQTIPATLALDTVGVDRGEYVGNSGHAQP
jgi:HSP20 family protein